MVMLTKPLMKVYIAKMNEEIIYFATGFFYKDELISSVVGHEPDISKQLGFYRLGINFLMLLTEKKQIILNLSSGSGKFKLNRGCKSELEYELLYFQHLPFYKRISWRLISLIYNNFGKKIFSILNI